MIGGIVVCNNSANPRSRSIQRVDISNPGAGYTIAPGIRFIGGSGVGAAATSKIGDGVVGVVTVQSGGSGYTTSPITFNDEVFLSGVTTVSAAVFTAVLSASGSISAINLTTQVLDTVLSAASPFLHQIWILL